MEMYHLHKTCFILWPDSYLQPAEFIIALAQKLPSSLPPQSWNSWIDDAQELHKERIEKNIATAQQKSDFVNPVHLCMEIEKYVCTQVYDCRVCALDSSLADDAVLVGDGGDFVATVAYNIKTRRPLGCTLRYHPETHTIHFHVSTDKCTGTKDNLSFATGLDPGLFGTLGCGGGFALAAKLVHPADEGTATALLLLVLIVQVWLFWGDGACGFSLMEFDTYRRFGVPVIAVIGNDACWNQIHRYVFILGGEIIQCNHLTFPVVRLRC